LRREWRLDGRNLWRCVPEGNWFLTLLEPHVACQRVPFKGFSRATSATVDGQMSECRHVTQERGRERDGSAANVVDLERFAANASTTRLQLTGRLW
jgi:hypothetical protein